MNAFSRAALTGPRVSRAGVPAWSGRFPWKQDRSPGVLMAISLETGLNWKCPQGGFSGDRMEVRVSSGQFPWSPLAALWGQQSGDQVPSGSCLHSQPASSRSCHSSRDLLAPMAQSPVSSSRSGLSLVSVSAPGCRPGSRLSLAAGRSAAMAAGDRRPAGAPFWGWAHAASTARQVATGAGAFVFPHFFRK